MKKLLLYNFTKERTERVRRAVKPLGCTVRSVTKKELAQPVGAIAAISGYAVDKRRISQGEFSDEMMVICGFSGDGLDVLLNALRQGGVTVPLKAVLTETNAAWDGFTLWREIKAEHEALGKAK